jgi:hypothetical protein
MSKIISASEKVNSDIRLLTKKHKSIEYLLKIFKGEIRIERADLMEIERVYGKSSKTLLDKLNDELIQIANAQNILAFVLSTLSKSPPESLVNELVRSAKRKQVSRGHCCLW